MKKSSQKFLEFNGKNIFFLAKDGQHWIAIKPICEALGLEYTRQFKNIKEDDILGQLLAEQPIVAADGRLRKMICLPEKWVYGWLFNIRSESEGLKDFKRECYEVLYNHFHGGIRKDLLAKQIQNDIALSKARKEFDDELGNNEKYKRVIELEEEAKTIKKQITQKEKEERMGMRDMFDTEN